jgi:hypothetical protein
MHVPDHAIAQETPQTFHTLPDNGGPKMAHMERLGHIGSAVVHDDGLVLSDLLHTVLWFLVHGV